MTIHGARLLKSLNIIITSWKWKIKKKMGRLKLNALMLQNKEKYIVRRKKKNNFIAFYFAVCCFAA